MSQIIERLNSIDVNAEDISHQEVFNRIKVYSPKLISFVERSKRAGSVPINPS